MDAVVVLVLAFASCKPKRVWLLFIQAVFTKGAPSLVTLLSALLV